MAISMARAKALVQRQRVGIGEGQHAAGDWAAFGGTAAAKGDAGPQAPRQVARSGDEPATHFTSQGGCADVDAAARIGEKAELFAEVLGRFSAQLAKMEADGQIGRADGAAAVDADRAVEHASGDAGGGPRIRSRRSSANLDPPKKKKLRAAAKAARARQAAAVEEVGQRRKSKRPPSRRSRPSRPLPPVSKKRSRVPVAAKATAIVAGREAQGLRVTKQQQLKVQTIAKQDRLKAGGLIRIQKNRSAANKRSQGRRDSR